MTWGGGGEEGLKGGAPGREGVELTQRNGSGRRQTRRQKSGIKGQVSHPQRLLEVLKLVEVP